MIESRTKRLAADIGGTFTDGAALDEKTGEFLLGKTLSTPRRLISGITNRVRDAGTRFGDANLYLHGSTIAINTLLERSVARTALLTTNRYRDAYDVGRFHRPVASHLSSTKHA